MIRPAPCSTITNFAHTRDMTGMDPFTHKPKSLTREEVSTGKVVGQIKLNFLINKIKNHYSSGFKQDSLNDAGSIRRSFGIGDTLLYIFMGQNFACRRFYFINRREERGSGGSNEVDAINQLLDIPCRGVCRQCVVVVGGMP